MRIARVVIGGMMSAAPLPTLAAQNVAQNVASTIPIRQVAPPQGSVAVGLLPVARGLSDGRVLTTSPLAPVVWVTDSSLSSATAFFDSTKLSASSGPVRRAISLIPYLGDSTLVVDPASSALLVLDPQGAVKRVMAPPRVSDLTMMAGSSIGRFQSGVDSRGRVVYRGRFVPPRPTTAPAPGTLVMPTAAIDSFPIVRADFTTGAIDTLAVVHAASGLTSLMTQDPATGRISMTMTRNPLPRPDDWVLLEDGGIAIVRAQDYHVDWVYADGTRASTPKMPFDWRRLTDEDKQRIIDSVRNLEMRARARSDSLAAARGVTAPSMLRTEFVDAKQLPDYYPPIRSSGGVVPDRDNNVWILPSTSAQAVGGLLYDVVNQRGEVFERVQLPALCSLAGFGMRGVIYVACMGEGGARLQRTRVIR